MRDDKPVLGLLFFLGGDDAGEEVIHAHNQRGVAAQLGGSSHLENLMAITEGGFERINTIGRNLVRV